MKKKTIYIAGKIRGLDPEKVKAKFAAKQAQLEAQGYSVFNPVALVEAENHRRAQQGHPVPPLDDYATRNELMRYLLGWLLEADELCLLPCWTDSQGAKIEARLAKDVGMGIKYGGGKK